MSNPAYDPDQYWEARGGSSYRDYTESPGYRHYRDAQFAFFRRLIATLQPDRLLDFGCGSGKLFPLWESVPHVDGYDRARSQVEIARVEAFRVRASNPYRVMHCLAPERADTPYDDDYFDLVVAAEVLLHVLPEDVDALVAELHRVCRGHLAIIVPAPFDNPAPHCFDHDYETLFHDRFVMTDDHCLHAQRYITARKIGVAGQTDAHAKEASDAIISP